MKIANYLNTNGGGKNLPIITRWLMSIVNGYNHEKYWRRRELVIDPHSRLFLTIKVYYL
jgi:hypothetical protein